MPAEDGPSLSKATFDRLVIDHLPAMLGFSIRLTGDPHAAEDVMQEALLRAARAWQGLRRADRFTAWLTRIVVNVFRDRLSRAGAGEPLPDDLSDGRAEDPAAAAAADETEALVARAVSQLPPRQREVLILTVYEQLDAREVADLLDLSIENVRTNLHYARRQLQRRLATLLQGGSDGGRRATT